MMTRLRKIVDTKNKFKKGLGRIANKIHKPYYGFVRETTFDLFNNPTLWNDSSIQVTGKINRTDSGSIMKVSIRIAPVNNLTPSLLAISSCLFPIALTLMMAELTIILGSLLVTAFCFGMVFLPFKINYVETRDKLESLLQLKNSE